jgi:PAS domain S-box-containing protein
MIFLDMRTIILSYAIIDIVCLLVIVRLWWQSRKRFEGTLFWVFDFFFQLSALFLIILRGQIPNWMSYVFASTMVMTGALLGYMGLERFVERRSSQLYNYALLIAFVLVHSYFTFVQPDQAARNFDVSVGLLVICFQCAWLLLHSAKPVMRQLTKTLGVIFSLYCIVNMVRIVEYFIGTHIKSDYLQSGTFELLALVSNQMLFIFLTYSLVLTFNKRLLLEIGTQEEKYSKAFYSSPYAMMLSRLSDGQIIEVNEGFISVTGYHLSDLSERNAHVLRLWDRNEDRAFIANELTDKGKVRDHEFQFRTKSGVRITGIYSAEIIIINNEKCVLSSINDITDRKHAELMMKESQRVRLELVDRLNEAQHVAMIGSWEWDLQTSTVWWSDETYLIFGVTQQDFVPSFEENGRFIHPDDVVKYEKSFEHSFKTGEQLNVYLRIIAKDGQLKYCHAKGMIIFDDSGRQIRFIGTITDITEQKLSQEKFRILNEKLEKRVVERTRELHNSQMALLNMVDDLNQNSKTLTSANSALDAVNKELAAFSYSVSHDLRAPLRSIDGFSQALLEDCADKLDDDGKKYLERIRQATQSMGRLIDDMLNLSKVTQSEFHQEQIDLSKMVHEIVDANQQRNSLNSLVINIQEDIIVRGDQRLMNIAMTNLLDNAWKFSGRQEHPRVEFGAIVKDGERIIFVRDNGVGFDMNYAGKLFGAFQRLHRSDEFPGTGIGLATVRRVMNRHNGQIWVESEVGKGATFYFTLPE